MSMCCSPFPRREALRHSPAGERLSALASASALLNEARESKPWGGQGVRSTLGQTLVEFALILPFLLMLLLGIFEFGRVMESQVTIQHAADEAARFAVTGIDSTSGTGVRETKIVQAATRASTGLSIDSSATSSSPGYFVVAIRSSLSPGGSSENNAGGANDFVRVEVIYNHPWFTGILNSAVPYLPLRAEALVVNERFARPIGQVGELPPEPPSVPPCSCDWQWNATGEQWEWVCEPEVCYPPLPPPAVPPCSSCSSQFVVDHWEWVCEPDGCYPPVPQPGP